jgi:quercetin dioxygenase-like cupin family protein
MCGNKTRFLEQPIPLVWINKMPEPFQFIGDLAKSVDIPAQGITSKTLFNDDRLKVVLFAFAAGEELSEHTGSTAATIHILSGQAKIGLGDQRREAGPGTWVHMEPRLPHSILADSPTTMLLMLLKA